ncbi:MAG: hypothetical protein ACR2NA_12210, partial [Solirubrobacterales bacterium]
MGAPPTTLTFLPPTSGILSRRARLAGRALDATLEARQRALGAGRVLDRLAESQPQRDVLVLAIYRPDRAQTFATEIARLRRATRHRLRLAFGSTAGAGTELAVETVVTDLAGGKFANLNRVAEAAAPLAADWILILDDDIALPRRYVDRLVCVCEGLRFELAQPALTRSSHTAWPVVRRRPALARQTAGVEIGPATVLSRAAWRELTPFPTEGMGWGLDAHWAAVARERGWRVGVVDAVPVRHTDP